MSTASAAGTGSVTLIPEAYRHIVNPAVLGALTVWDKAARAETTLYVATRGFVSSPSDDPANTIFYERLLESGSVSQDLFDAVTTSGRSRYGVGNATLNNADHGLDDWLTSYAFDGRVCEFWYGDLSRPFPDGWTKIFHGTMLPPDADESTISLNFRDAQAKLDAPLQTTRYAGTNVLPDGLEGTADDLKGKPKPVCMGPVTNVAPPCVNTSKLIYQVNDGAVDSISVKDGGVILDRTLLQYNTSATTLFSGGGVTGLAYGAGVFCAARSFLIGTSSDGESWTQTFSGTTEQAASMGYGGGQFLCGGTGPKMQTSPDGSTWTDRPGISSLTSGVVYGLAYIATEDRWLAGTTTGKAGYSDDGGVTWTSVTYGGPIIYYMAYGYGMAFASSGADWYKSSDYGASWSSGTSPIGAETIYAIKYINHRFIVIGTNGSVATSIDGATWTTVDIGTTETAWSVNYAPNLGYIIACTNNVVLRSQDLAVWTTFDSPVAGQTIVHIGSSTDGELSVVIGSSGTVAYTAPPTGYSTEADLLDDAQAPAPGTYRPYLAGGYFRLGSPPAGQITADVVQGAAAADRTAGQLFTQVAQKAGLSAGDWSAQDIIDLDVRDDSEVGYWSGLNDVNCSEVADRLLSSIGGWWGADELGVLRVGVLDDPTSRAEEISLTQRDVDATDRGTTLRRIRPNDSNQGVPPYRIVVRYAKNWTTQDSGIFGIVSQTDRERLASEYLESVLEDSNVQQAHPLSLEMRRETLLANASDADALAARLQDLFGFEGEAFTFDTEFHVNKRLRVGKVLRLTNPYYGLSAGARFVLLGLETRPTEVPPTSTWTIWRPRSTSRAAPAGVGSVTATIGIA